MTSCLKDEDEKVYTKAEEEALRSIYLHNLEYEGVDIDTTENGVFYIVREEGEGDFVQEGDTLSVGYSGYFIDCTLFDTTIGRGDGKMSFVYGKDSFIEGWDEGMKVMNEGALVQFIIPSELAY